MINHARTLLMNVLADSTALLTLPGEEIIPPEFRPRGRAHTAAAREVLFGTNPDRYLLNYRCRQYLSLLHATELDHYLTALDARVTYDFADQPFYDEDLFRPIAVQIAGTATDLYLQGAAGPPDGSGRMRRVWQLSVVSGETARVRLETPLSQEIVAYTVSNQLSSPVGLPGSQLIARFRPQVGAAWRIEVLSRPQRDLSQIEAATHDLPAEVLELLFRDPLDTADVEPWQTFRALWEAHPVMAYRLGGFLLALIYQLDRIPPT